MVKVISRNDGSYSSLLIKRANNILIWNGGLMIFDSYNSAQDHEKALAVFAPGEWVSALVDPEEK